MAERHTAIRDNVKNLNVFICFDLWVQYIDDCAGPKGNTVKMSSESMSGYKGLLPDFPFLRILFYVMHRHTGKSGGRAGPQHAAGGNPTAGWKNQLHSAAGWVCS
jgi:hypothetical protein